MFCRIFQAILRLSDLCLVINNALAIQQLKLIKKKNIIKILICYRKAFFSPGLYVQKRNKKVFKNFPYRLFSTIQKESYHLKLQK